MKRNTATAVICITASAIAFLVGYGAFLWGFNAGAHASGIGELIQRSNLNITKQDLPSWVTSPEVDATPVLVGNIQDTFSPQTTDDSLALQNTRNPQVTLHSMFIQGN